MPELNKENIRSTALSKAISSIPTCGYVDRRDKIDHHVRNRGNQEWREHTKSLNLPEGVTADSTTINNWHDKYLDLRL